MQMPYKMSPSSETCMGSNPILIIVLLLSFTKVIGFFSRVCENRLGNLGWS